MSGTPKKAQTDRELMPERKVGFVAVLAECCNVGRACASVGIGRTTAYRWREEDPGFAEAWDKALAIGVSALEDEAHRRAFEGVDEPLTHQGQFTYLYRTRLDENGDPVLNEHGLPIQDPVLDENGEHKVAAVRKYSDTLAIFLLKAHDPAKYRENSRMELTGPDGEALNLSDTERAEKIAALLAAAQQRKADDDASDLV